MLTRSGARHVVCAHGMGVMRRAAGRVCAVRVVAAPTCALIASGAPDVFLVLSAKVKKKTTIARRHSAGGAPPSFERFCITKLADVQEGVAVVPPPPNFVAVRVRTAPPLRDVHHGVDARLFYHFQSFFSWQKKVFLQLCRSRL